MRCAYVKKVYEIAKELEMESKELLEKINGMGIEAKSHNSVISDIDVKAITNMILHSRTKTTETKIVKAPPKRQSGTNEQEVKIAVKAAPAASKTPREKAEPKTRATSKAPEKRSYGSDVEKEYIQVKAPVGPVQPPIGTPLPKSASTQPPTGIPLPKSASKQPPVGVPLPKSKSQQHHTKIDTVKQGIDPETEIKEKVSQPVSKTEKTEPVISVDNETHEKKEYIDDSASAIETPDIPKGLVIKKRAADIAAEKAAAEQEKKEAERKPVAPEKREDTKIRQSPKESQQRQEKQERPERPERPERQGHDTRRQEQGQATRRPAQGQDSRRPAQGQDSRRPEQGQGARRPAQGQDARRPAQGQDARRPAQGQDTRRPAQGQNSRRPAPSNEEAIPEVTRPRKEAPGEGPAGKKAKDKRTQSFQENTGKKDYRRKTELLKTSMEKPVPKKYKKKAEKLVEEISNIDLDTLAPGSKVINVPITVKGLSEQIEKTTSEIILALMKLGIMANINQNLDGDTAVLLGAELGVNIVLDHISEEVAEEGLEIFEDKESDLRDRPPIITVMGHVDHGKTSLLDAIRKTNVTITKSGGITQHIGASEVTINGQRIVFLDTPGHEAFTAMRARGAHITDIAVLVVAADDSVKPQTIESISHARAAGIPIIVAINKTDKPEANPDRVKQDLANLPADQRVLVEEYGGDTISVPVSAKTGEGIHSLLEMILLQAEVLELKANPNRLAMGTVVEARLDKAKGPVATLLVLNGTLQTGMSVVVGTCSGKIRAMTNFKGDTIKKAGPATAVEILGLNEVPEAGDEFNAVKEDRIAREIAEQRRLKVREEVMVRNSSTTLEQLFSQIKEGEVKELNLVIKADVQGSVGALISSLEKLHNENVKVRIIHSGVGTITESDIMLASTSDAIIIGFNVRPSSNITSLAERESIEIRTYRVIYDIIDDIEAAMKGMLDPIFKEVVLGKVEIRNTFKVPGIGIVGGAYVTEGKILRNVGVRLVRDGIVIHEGKISSLKRFKDDAKEVAQGYECGIGIENYNDIKEGDIIEAFKMEEIVR